MSTNELKISVALLSVLAFANLSADAIGQDVGSATANSPSHDSGISALTRKQIIDARREFKVEVLSFDVLKRYGSQFPYSDYMRLRITNNSRVTLSYLTPLTKRYSHGHAVGWSRAPAIPVHDVGPEQSKIVDYYPHGHLSVVTVDKLTVEIEPTVDEEDVRLFKELAQ